MDQNSVEKTATSQNAQKSVLMQSVLQKIKTTQTGGDSQVVRVEKKVTEVKVMHTEKRLQETTSTLMIENSVKMKNNEDSDEEFDFDTPTTKTSERSQNSDSQKLKETQASMTAKSKAVSETSPLFENAEKQPPMMSVTKDPEIKTSPAVGVVQKAPTSTSEGLTQGLPEKSVAAKFIGQSQTVCENGTVSEMAHVQNNVEDEWDKVQTIEAGFVDENDTKKKVEYHGFSKLKHFLFGPPKLHRDLHDERDRIFCIAASVLENSDQIHVRSLQTIYRSLTGSRFDCPRYGNHWEEIGFQGRDPATDLRGVGLLGLLHLVYLLRDAKRHVLASEIYKLSLHPTQNFPFCVMSINLTRIALQALREGCLNK
uniref:ELMO domain-containing protein 3 n=1 Tax=Magallana gigas TaxID=29159 RepID=K1QQE3_MAGGI